MSILLPEKIVIATLAAGLETVKANTSYFSKIFDEEVMGSDFVMKATDYLSGNKVRISQGYGIDDTRLPGWYVVPANVSPSEDFIGDYIAEEDTTDEDSDGDVYEGNLNAYTLRVISATPNGDATMILEAVARYILLSAREVLGQTYGLNEVAVTATDLDPVYQYLPEHLFYRSTVMNFQGMNSWATNYSIIKDTELFIKFSPNETYIEV